MVSDQPLGLVAQPQGTTVNKTHIASTGVGAGFLALGINLFFPNLHLTPDQMAYLVGVLPSVAMGLLAGAEVVWPKLVPVVSAVTKA